MLTSAFAASGKKNIARPKRSQARLHTGISSSSFTVQSEGCKRGRISMAHEFSRRQDGQYY